MKSSPAPSAGGLSLERKLPLLITLLLAVTMAAGVVFAYVEVKQTSVDSARERLRLVSRQLADLVAPSVPQRLTAMRNAARDPAVRAFVDAPTPASRAAATAALERMRTRPSSAQPEVPVVVWGRGRTQLLQLGQLPDSAGDPSAQTEVAVALLGGPGGVSRFFSIGPRSYFWLVVPVPGKGEPAGYVGELRPVGGASTARQVETLIGRDVSVFFANTAGGPWIALDGSSVAPPASWPFSGAERYRSGPDGERFGHVEPIEGTPWSMVAQAPLASILARPNTFLRRSVLAALLLGAAGAMGAWVLSRSITRPVRELRLASEAIARGDYARRIELQRTDELGVLADSFNRMAAQVQTTHRELREQYETAQSLAQELEHANEAKSEFLATMSHEIRTPINAIIGYTDLLQLGVTGPVTEEQQAQLERIRISGRHLTGLVDQVLDLARIEAGTLRIEHRVASVAATIETALTVLRPQADDKGVELLDACEGPAELSYVGDPQHVDQVVMNLLSNAIKFTERGGRVSLHCELVHGELPGHAGTGAWTCLTVEDTGVGIPREERERIFEPFVQVDRGYTRRHSGAGLGLAISLHLARSMDGELTVESEPGQGSRFTLWLPAAPAASLTTAGGPLH